MKLCPCMLNSIMASPVYYGIISHRQQQSEGELIEDRSKKIFWTQCKASNEKFCGNVAFLRYTKSFKFRSQSIDRIIFDNYL